MAINLDDSFRESETRATYAALRQIPSETRLQSAISRTGTPQNTLASNSNPDAGPNAVLRCDTVNIEDGVLSE
jgi:hypothetical protein